MDSGAALRVRAESSVGVAHGSAARVPARHLRVLPPPRAYAEPVAPATRQGESRPAGRARTVAGRAVPPPVPTLRLTARGRRVVAVAVLLLGLGVVALVGAALGEDGGGLELMGTTKVIVEPGDTLWSIAGAAAGGRDVRDVIVDIRRLNELGSAAIAPGQVLLLP
ncbi:LysM peptidoglycan-binding domain-containing protein [Blastococcus sp. KM273129]|uniref:LysM peptidoglycan-binding domain-containing protein n=1 Tax=Blastococcus sp. KM273129 TaxID=2570315 RepID=UPI001F2247A3|nr:LysM peptidoglycan-binding domain-containing protein [Blastococcus sp. KM273129]MCF6733621.1 LysM peptidoglycan-binding domain-containing protein [Blastococcus sp. KM273129]